MITLNVIFIILPLYFMLPSATGKLLGIKQQLSNTFRIPCEWVGHLKCKSDYDTTSYMDWW